jgi:hypothetical protein
MATMRVAQWASPSAYHRLEGEVEQVSTIKTQGPLGGPRVQIERVPGGVTVLLQIGKRHSASKGEEPGTAFAGMLPAAPVACAQSY